MDKSRLIISANSSALARWDARLGLQPRPFIAGLSSLSSDGGIIALVDVVVEKIFPLAYMNGAKGQRESPWDETEEQARQKQWLRRYSAESTRLQEGLRKNLERLENLLGLLQDAQTGGGIWERESSTDVEDDLDLLLADLNPYVRLRDMSNGQVSQLATSARQRMERELTDGQAEIEAELEVWSASDIAEADHLS
jgi:breast cancer 2 susceptibility protein